MNSKLPRRRNITAAILALSVSVMLMPAVATAQESDGWNFRVAPYLWALSLDGTTAVAGSDLPLDASFGDILDLVNLAFSVNMEWDNGKWYVVLDPMWADLEAEIETGGPIAGDVEIELIIIDAHVGFSVTEHFDIYAGARYYDQDITIIPDLLPEIPLGDDWTDILLGVRLHGDMSGKWSFTGKLDGAVGGDSDSAWYAQALFLRQFSGNRQLAIGYRHYDVDYESGSGLSLFKWDVAHSGPVIGYVWNF